MFGLYCEDLSEIIPPNSEDNTGGLYLGNLNASKDIMNLKSLGVKFVVTALPECIAENKEFIEHGIVQHIVPSDDVSNYDIGQFFDNTVNFIIESLKQGNVLVHCAAGISRSSTLVIAFLISNNNWPFKIAFPFVQSKRGIIFPNFGFQKQLKSFQQRLGIPD